MSMLSVVSRAGPSVQRGLIARTQWMQLPGTVSTVRGKKTSVEAPTISQPGYILKRKEKGDKGPTKRKKLPQYKTLPTNQLQEFVSTSPSDFVIPVFNASTGQSSAAIGSPVEFNPTQNDPLRIFGLPKNLLLEFRLLSKPYTVIRQATKDAFTILDKALKAPSAENRVVLTGKPGCGKSFLLLQMVEHAILNKWVVIYIPRGVDLVNSTTSYTYDLRTQTYLQPGFAFQTLQRMLSVNAEAFKRISLTKDIVLEKNTIPARTSLEKTIKFALDERKRSVASAPAILDGVMTALQAQTEFPVLLAVDQFQALYGKTLYRDPQFVPIKSFHLSMPRLLMEFASGQRSFKRGAVVGALATSQSTNPVPIELRNSLDLPELDTKPISGYEKCIKTMEDYARGLKKFEVPEKLTLEEAVGVFELWKGRKVFGRASTYYDETFLGKYTESGGNPRQFVWKGLLANFDA